MGYKEKWGKLWSDGVDKSVWGELADKINQDCEMCNGAKDVCYHTLENPCKLKDKKKGKGVHECDMLGRCPRCELVCAAYDFAMENGGKGSMSKLRKEFSLGYSGLDNLCKRLEAHGISIIS
jgi:hypothetical protein